MAGFYIHIPFCRKACSYCNFHFSTSIRKKDELIKAIQKEISLKKNYLPEAVFDTIYLGGGTPSLLGLSEIEDIIDTVYKNYSVSAKPEISLEANPDDLNIEKIKGYKSLGINRLSIGIQSFDDEDLGYLGRIHTAAEALNCILSAQQNGFENISIDLIYGIPGSNPQRWERNLVRLVSLCLPHFSAYALTVEPRTPLNYLIGKGRKTAVDDELINEQFFQLVEFADKNNFEHYEISNFAKPGMKSRHNSAYWEGIPYLGVGPSAHSYDLLSRQWNTSINQLYMDKINANEVYFEKESLTEKDRINEFLMLSLRTKEGLDLEKLKALTNETVYQRMEVILNENLKTGLVIKAGNRIILTARGMLFSDSLIASLFMD